MATQRSIIEPLYEAGYSTKEIAARTGYSNLQVRRVECKVRKDLREQLTALPIDRFCDKFMRLPFAEFHTQVKIDID